MAPAMSVTAAPRSRAASAMAAPILPDGAVADEAHRVERLARAAGADDDVQALEVARAGEEVLDRLDDAWPAPPAGRCRSGPRRARRPRARRRGSRTRAAWRRCAGSPGCVHMPASMAGATITGARLAQAMAVTASPTRPAASSPSRFAVAGARTIASAASASSMWAICWSASSSNTSSSTGRWVRLAKVSGPTKRVAAGGHGHVDHRAALGEHAHQGDGLVGGDAAGDADHDAAARQAAPVALAHRSALARRGALTVAHAPARRTGCRAASGPAPRRRCRAPRAATAGGCSRRWRPRSPGCRPASARPARRAGR